VNQPAVDYLRKLVDQLRAAQTADEVVAVVRSAREVGLTGPSVAEVLEAVPWLVRGGEGTVAGRPVIVLPAERMRALGVRVTKLPLLDQYAALPCGQQIGVLVVILLMVLLTFDAPADVQEKIWGAITTLGAGIAAIKWMTKN
jgi:hypothetical protein